MYPLDSSHLIFYFLIIIIIINMIVQPIKTPMPDLLFLGIRAFRHLLMIFQNIANLLSAAGYGYTGCFPFHPAALR